MYRVSKEKIDPDFSIVIPVFGNSYIRLPLSAVAWNFNLISL